MGRSAAIALSHALGDALLSVGSLTVSYRLGKAFFRRFLTRGSVRHHPNIERLFAVTFSLSLSLVLLILFDAMALMHISTRRLHWLFDVYFLLGMLVFVLPAAQVHHVLIDSGWTALEASRAAFVAELLFLYLFVRIGDPFSRASDQKGRSIVEAIKELLSVEAGMSRILIIGTTILAVLSGFTAVNLPYIYLSWFINRVTEKEVFSLEKKVLMTLEDLASEKRHILETEETFQPQSENPRVPRVVKIRDMPTAVSVAERNAEALFLEYNKAASAWNDSMFARTNIGRLFTLLGTVMLLLCGIRVSLALYNIFCNLRGGRRGIRDTAKLFLDTEYFLKRYGVHVDGKVLYQYATLGFTSVLILVNLRAALTSMSKAFSLISGNDALSSSAPVFIAHLMGTYVISSTVLIRTFLPPGTRVLIADVVGNMEFQYFQNWFDILFISSAGLGTLILLYHSGRLKRGSSYRKKFVSRRNGWSRKFASD